MMFYMIMLSFMFYFISFRGNTMLTTLYAINLHGSTFEVGVIAALSNLFPMVIAVYAGKISDRIGFRFPLVFGSFGVGFSLVLPYIFRDSMMILYISQSFLGVAFIFAIVNLQNLVGRMSTENTRSKNFSIHSLNVSIASLIGPPLTGFSIDHFGYIPTFLFLAVMAAVPGLLIVSNVLKLPCTTPKEKAPGNSVMDLLRSRSLRKLYITSAVLLTGVGLYDFYFPIYGNHINLSASLIGIILSANAVAYFIVRLFMPALIKKFDDELVFIGCLFLSSIGFILLPLFDGVLALSAVSFILGLGLGCGQPLSMVMAYNYSPEGRTGEVLGVRLTVNKIVQFLVPILFGSVGSVLGFLPIFGSNAVLFLASGLISWFDRKKPEDKSLPS